MSRPLGIPKTGGRKKGTPNKRTQDLDEVFRRLDFDVPTQIIESLPHLAPEKQVDTLMGLMSFLYPKRKAVEHVGSEREPDQDCELSKEELKARVLELRKLNDLTDDE